MIKEARFKELTDDTGRKHYRVSFFIHGADEEAIALLSNKLRGFLCFDIDRAIKYKREQTFCKLCCIRHSVSNINNTIYIFI